MVRVPSEGFISEETEGGKRVLQPTQSNRRKNRKEQDYKRKRRIKLVNKLVKKTNRNFHLSERVRERES